MEEEEEGEEEAEERAPDLQKDDMMARRTGVFHKQSTATAVTAVTYNRFLPLPTSVRSTQGEITTDAAPRNKKEVQAERSKMLNIRWAEICVELNKETLTNVWFASSELTSILVFSYFNYGSFSHRLEQQQPRVLTEPTQPHPDVTVVRAASRRERESDDNDEDGDCNKNEPVPDPEKDDMMARRTASFQKPSAVRTNQSISHFLPVPGSLKYSVAPVSAMKPFNTRRKHTEKLANERYTPHLNGDVVLFLQLTKHESLISLTSSYLLTFYGCCGPCRYFGFIPC